MSRNQIINATSVQSQFASLLRDKDNLQKQASNADRERYFEESKLQNLHSLQSTLSEKIRIAHTNLGVQAKKKQMLNTEMKRLSKVLEDDRKTIEALTVKIGKVERENIERKFQFVKEMDGLNVEMEDALRMYEESGLENILKSVNSCRYIERFLCDKLQQTDFVCEEHWKSIFNSISDAIRRLEANVKHLEKERGKQATIQKEAQDLRKTAQTRHSKVIPH